MSVKIFLRYMLYDYVTSIFPLTPKIIPWNMMATPLRLAAWGHFFSSVVFSTGNMEFYHSGTELHDIILPRGERYNISSCTGRSLSDILSLFFFFNFFKDYSFFFPVLVSNPQIWAIFIFLNHLKTKFALLMLLHWSHLFPTHKRSYLIPFFLLP